jgi:hypothetical protein
MLSTVNCIVNQRHHLETYTFPISSRKNTNSIEFFLCITIYIGYQTLLGVFSDQIRVITKLPNSEQSYKGKVKHKLIFSLQLIFVYCFHIHFGYVSYINLAQNRGVEDVNNHFQKCSMKVTFRKRHLKKTFIYSDHLLKNICQEDLNSHLSLI